MQNHPSDREIEKAIETLKKVIDAAENSNHNGEVALMKAVTAISKPPFEFPAKKIENRTLVLQAQEALIYANRGLTVHSDLVQDAIVAVAAWLEENPQS